MSIEEAIQHLKDTHKKEVEMAKLMKFRGVNLPSFSKPNFNYGVICRDAGYRQAIIDLEQLVKLKKFEQLNKGK